MSIVEVRASPTHLLCLSIPVSYSKARCIDLCSLQRASSMLHTLPVSEVQSIRPRGNAMCYRRPLRQAHQQHISSASKAIACESSRPVTFVHQSRRRQGHVACASGPQAFDTGGRGNIRLPTQGESVVLGPGGSDTMLQDLPGPPADIDYLAVSHCHRWYDDLGGLRNRRADSL